VITRRLAGQPGTDGGTSVHSTLRAPSGPTLAVLGDLSAEGYGHFIWGGRRVQEVFVGIRCAAADDRGGAVPTQAGIRAAG